MVRVRVRDWVMYYGYKSPHKGRNIQICVCVYIQWSCSLQAQCVRKRKGHLWMLKFSPLPLDKADCVWLPNQFWVCRSPFKSFHTLGLENYTGNTFATETWQPRAFLTANPSLSFHVELQVISVRVLWCRRWCNDEGASQRFGGAGVVVLVEQDSIWQKSLE